MIFGPWIFVNTSQGADDSLNKFCGVCVILCLLKKMCIGNPFESTSTSIWINFLMIFSITVCEINEYELTVSTWWQTRELLSTQGSPCTDETTYKLTELEYCITIICPVMENLYLFSYTLMQHFLTKNVPKVNSSLFGTIFLLTTCVVLINIGWSFK